MKSIIESAEFYHYDYTLEVINSLKQYWREQNGFSCINEPKKYNMLSFFSNCKGKYTLKNGVEYYADYGDIVYTSEGSEYLVEFQDIRQNGEDSIGINFYIYDKYNKPIILSDNGITVIKVRNTKYIHSLFSKTAEQSVSPIQSPAKLKSLLYEIFFEICVFYRQQNVINQNYNIIAKGIKYLEENETLELSVTDIAKLCNVSEVYFRKLFTQYSGISPNEYKLNKKISLAKQYLKYESMSIKEIAELCGFYDNAYFSKMFKKKTGMTPKGYRMYERRE